jgi:LuxR family maltose regulon positive regulatory protein
LEEFNVALCKAVLDPERDWETLMAYVQQSNLFVLPVDDEGIWLRYHHLFQDFLQTRLKKEDPVAFERILRALAQEYQSRERWAKTYRIYQRLEDRTAKIELVRLAGSPMIKSGRLQLLSQWIDDLPHPIQSNDPEIISLQGILVTGFGEIEHGLSLQTQVIATL